MTYQDYIGTRIPHELKEKIRLIHGDISKFVREAIEEKLARDEPLIRDKILNEISLFEKEIEKRKKLLTIIDEEEKQKEEQANIELLEILRTLFVENQNLTFPSDNGTKITVYGCPVKLYLERNILDKEKIAEDVTLALNQLSEIKGIPLSELKTLCLKYIEGFKELEGVL